MNAKLFLLTGSLSAAISVIIGAFGAHGLQKKVSEKMLSHWQTGVEYQFYHTFAVFIVGILAIKYSSTLLAISGWSFILGMLIFSGSLYALTLTGITKLGAITPLGGLLFIIGWAFLAIVVSKLKLS